MSMIGLSNASWVNTGIVAATSNVINPSIKAEGEIQCDSLSVGKKTSKYFHTIEVKFYDFISEGLIPSDRLVFKDEFSYISEIDITKPESEFIDYVFENKDKIQTAIDAHNLKTLSPKVTKFSDLQRHWNRVGTPVLIKE